MKKIFNLLHTKLILIGLVVIFVTSPVPAIPPDPDNAALLYYQGFLSLAELDKDALDHIADVARGEIAPDDTTREYINKCKGAIQFAEAAAEVLYCNWGVRYSQGFECLLPQMAQVRFLTFVLAADARIRASDGDYIGALERCLMMGTLARHIGDDTFISYLVTLSVRKLGYECMQDIVGQISHDEELLQWFKDELVTSNAVDISPVRTLKIEMEIVTDLMQMENVEKTARILTDSSIGIITDSNEKKIREIIKAIDGKTLEQARGIYSERMNSVLVVLSTPISYELADAKLKRLSDNFNTNDPAEALAGTFIPAFAKIYAQDTMCRTSFNATIAGIEICLSRIKTGKLPNELPENLPKDLFSGEDFEYEKTTDGFVLRCRGKDLDKDKTHEYEFKVKK